MYELISAFAKASLFSNIAPKEPNILLIIKFHKLLKCL